MRNGCSSVYSVVCVVHDTCRSYKSNTSSSTDDAQISGMMHWCTLTEDGWGVETPSSTWAILLMTSSVISCLSSSTCSPIRGMELSITWQRAEQPIRCNLAQSQSPAHPEWYLRLHPLGGSIVSPIMKMGHIQSPDDVGHSGICGDESFLERYNSLLAANLIYCRMRPDMTLMMTSLLVPMHYPPPQVPRPVSLLLHLLLSRSAALNHFEGLRPCRRAEQNGNDITEYLSNTALVFRPSDLFDNKSHEPKLDCCTCDSRLRTASFHSSGGKDVLHLNSRSTEYSYSNTDLVFLMDKHGPTLQVPVSNSRTNTSIYKYYVKQWLGGAQTTSTAMLKWRKKNKTKNFPTTCAHVQRNHRSRARTVLLPKDQNKQEQRKTAAGTGWVWMPAVVDDADEPRPRHRL